MTNTTPCIYHRVEGTYMDPSKGAYPLAFAVFLEGCDEQLDYLYELAPGRFESVYANGVRTGRTGHVDLSGSVELAPCCITDAFTLDPLKEIHHD